MLRMKRIHAASLAFLLLSARLAAAADDKRSLDMIDAAMMGDNAKVKALIAKGADVNAKGDGRPALVWAAQNGWIDVVRTLLEAKADVNVRDNLGLTPLERVVDVGGKPELLELLIKAGADVNIQYPSQIDPGRTLLMMAVSEGKAATVDALIKAKADVSLADRSGNTALTIAISDDHPELIAALLKSGANVNASRPSFGTPLHFALDNDKTAAAEALLKGGANVTLAGPAGQTALMLAIRKESPLLPKLLAAKADVNARDDQSLTPIYYAIEAGSGAAVTALIKAGADVNLPLNNGDTPLGFARRNGTPALVELIKAAGGKE
jgi:ankyrin repeat protein